MAPGSCAQAWLSFRNTALATVLSEQPRLGLSQACGNLPRFPTLASGGAKGESRLNPGICTLAKTLRGSPPSPTHDSCQPAKQPTVG